MIPQPGNIIVVFFRNGVQLEGIVVSWSDQKSVLKSPTGASLIVIQKTLDDIMCYKLSNAKTEYEKLKDKPRKEEDDIKVLAALKIELNELERAEAREKLTSHTAGEVKYNYGLPTNIPVKSVEQYPGEKTTSTDSGFSQELQNMFRKRD
jgi:sRNA-binding regulator protein Hfq